jgi:hypothetical protein
MTAESPLIDEMVTQEEWSAGVCSLVASELLRGAELGLLTPSEAHQLTTRFLVLLEQALDLPALSAGLAALNPWTSARRAH